MKIRADEKFKGLLKEYMKDRGYDDIEVEYFERTRTGFKVTYYKDCSYLDSDCVDTEDLLGFMWGKIG